LDFSLFVIVNSPIKLQKMSKLKDKKEKKRKYPVTAMLNDKEFAAMQKYCQKYKVKNRSKFIRETIFSSIIQEYERDYPTLFDKQVLADLVVERR